MSVKIVIADDHKMMRDGLCALLEKHPNMEVIAEVENGNEVVEAASQLSPDVIIMDISMPGLNGIEATRKILEKNPNIKILGLSMHADAEYVSGLLVAGASGYVLKDCTFGELIQAINSVVRNKSYLCPEIASVVIHDFKMHRVSFESNELSILTPREREILQLITEGLSTKDIARKLSLSVKTIAAHRQSIMDKLNCHNVVDLTKYAIRRGFAST